MISLKSGVLDGLSHRQIHPDRLYWSGFSSIGGLAELS